MCLMWSVVIRKRTATNDWVLIEEVEGDSLAEVFTRIKIEILESRTRETETWQVTFLWCTA